jgi:hypothetical protein
MLWKSSGGEIGTACVRSRGPPPTSIFEGRSWGSSPCQVTPRSEGHTMSDDVPRCPLSSVSCLEVASAPQVCDAGDATDLEVRRPVMSGRVTRWPDRGGDTSNEYTTQGDACGCSLSSVSGLSVRELLYG